LTQNGYKRVKDKMGGLFFLGAGFSTTLDVIRFSAYGRSES